MISRYFSACLGILPRVGFLGEHSDSRRFKGTKVYVRSNTISPDYPIDATIHHTENNGLNIWITWADINGKFHGPYLLQPEDRIEVINLRDAKALSVIPTPVEVVKKIQDVRDRRLPSDKLVSFLRKNDVGCKMIGDRISIIMGRYYIDCVGDKFELGDERRGVISSYPQSKEGAQKLLKKIEKIENNFDYERLLQRVGE